MNKAIKTIKDLVEVQHGSPYIYLYLNDKNDKKY